MPRKRLKKRGHPPHKPNEKTRKAVERAVRYGMVQTEICAFMGFSLSTLYKYYRKELDTAGQEMMLDVSKNVHEIALDKADPRALSAGIFLMKTRWGMREVSRTEISGPNGGPVQLQAVKAVIDPRDMSPEAREELKRLIEDKMDELEDAGDDGEEGEDFDYEAEDYADDLEVEDGGD